MAHPDIQNQTPFAFGPLFVADEDGRPLVAPILKGTFDALSDGRLAVSEVQEPVSFAGEAYGVPGESSYKWEPETAFVKLATDVVLLGHAYSPYVGAERVDVEFRIGPTSKVVRAWGDRRVVSGVAGAAISAPEPFETIPLQYERAFGGWDRSPEDVAHHAADPRNPVGVGFRTKHGRVRIGDPIPNLEDPGKPLESVGGSGFPAGFGFVAPDWHPRSFLAGTYDAAWSESRSPLLPADFDRRFFNAGSAGLVFPGSLRGDEAISVRNATPDGHWGFRLPGVPNPRCVISTKHGERHELEARLDTVVVDADTRQLTLLWRCHALLRDGPLDVRAIHVSTAPGLWERNVAVPAPGAEFPTG